MKKAVSSVAMALLAGADWLEQHDWLQCRTWNEDRSAACLIGAVIIATKSLPTNPTGPIFSANFDWWSSLIEFNNAPGRTKEEVIAKMRELAALY